ncbi:MAG: hypothetical protein ACK4MF_00780 [Hyphomicrobiaceae bacterium]
MNIHALLAAMRQEFRRNARGAGVNWSALVEQQAAAGTSADVIEYIKAQLAAAGLEQGATDQQAAVNQQAAAGIRGRKNTAPPPPSQPEVTNSRKLLLGLEMFMAAAAGRRHYFVSLGLPTGVPGPVRAHLLKPDECRILLDDVAGKRVLDALSDATTRDCAAGRLLAEAAVPPAPDDTHRRPAQTQSNVPVVRPVNLADVAAWSIHVDRLGVTIKALIEEILRLERDFDATILVSGNLHNMAPILLKMPTDGKRGYSIATSECGLTLLAIR